MLVNFNAVLRDAQAGHYAVGLFNTTDTNMLQAAIEAAEELRSPIIIGTAEILLPYGELQLIAPSVLAAARRASISGFRALPRVRSASMAAHGAGRGWQSIPAMRPGLPILQAA